MKLGSRDLALLRRQARESNWVIAVDGGIRALRKVGIRPDLFVGDLDSLGGSMLPRSLDAVFLPTSKDCSDLAAALAIGQGIGATAIRAWGVLGGSHGHHWAALHDLAEAASVRGMRSVEAFSAGGVHAVLLSGKKSLTLDLPSRSADLRVSLLAVGGVAKGVRTRGLKYRLSGESLGGGSRGLSNRPDASTISVSVSSGTLLVMVEPGLASER